MTIDNVRIDRPHRFAEGDEVVHVDSPDEPATVAELTYRVVCREDGSATAYPTYVLHDAALGETIEGVLCTRDLAPARHPARRP